MIRLAGALAVALIATGPPDGPPAPPAAELGAITARGKDLAAYDRAAWKASDALQAKNPRPGSVTGYVARRTDRGWVVDFGRLDPAKANFLIAYEATPAGKPDSFQVEAFDPPRPDPGFCRSASRATEAAIKDFTAHFEGEQRPYNVAILPADAGRLYVYLTPAPTKPGLWPLGGDVRFLVSADGGKVIERRQLHKAVIELPPPAAGADQTMVASVHNHVLTETPEDTDVFHVLSRKPARPELIRTEHHVYDVEPDGSIEYLGKAEDFGKPKK